MSYILVVLAVLFFAPQSQASLEETGIYLATVTEIGDSVTIEEGLQSFTFPSDKLKEVKVGDVLSATISKSRGDKWLEKFKKISGETTLFVTVLSATDSSVTTSTGTFECPSLLAFIFSQSLKEAHGKDVTMTIEVSDKKIAGLHGEFTMLDPTEKFNNQVVATMAWVNDIALAFDLTKPEIIFITNSGFASERHHPSVMTGVDFDDTRIYQIGYQLYAIKQYRIDASGKME